MTSKHLNSQNYVGRTVSRQDAGGGPSVSGSVFHLVYVSSAVDLMDQPALEAILTTARAKNQRRGVTGMLVYHDGNFMQALEGDEAVVAALADSIGRDPRHKDMRVVVRYANDTRDFADWDMAFRQLGPEDAEAGEVIDLMRDRKRLEEEFAKGGIARLWLGSFCKNAR
jgi:Sensors of blue-light using FAD